MQKSDIKSKLRRSGFVFTDCKSGARVTARGPQSPSGDGEDGERSTVVKAERDDEVLASTSERSHGAAAARYIEYVEEYG